MADVIIRPSLKFVIARFLVADAILIAAIFYETQVAEQFNLYVVFAALALNLWPISHLIRRQATRLIIAGDKLRYETGVFSKTTRTQQLTKVQDVRVDRTFGQRLLGIGDLTIETAGESSRITIADIDAPQAVADQIIGFVQKGIGHGI